MLDGLRLVAEDITDFGDDLRGLVAITGLSDWPRPRSTSWASSVSPPRGRPERRRQDARQRGTARPPASRAPRPSGSWRCATAPPQTVERVSLGLDARPHVEYGGGASPPPCRTPRRARLGAGPGRLHGGRNRRSEARLPNALQQIDRLVDYATDQPRRDPRRPSGRLLRRRGGAPPRRLRAHHPQPTSAAAVWLLHTDGLDPAGHRDASSGLTPRVVQENPRGAPLSAGLPDGAVQRP